MSERRLPIFARWTVVAQGSVVDRRSARPQCPVAAWLVSTRPELVPFDPDPDRLSSVRVRTEIIDVMLLAEADAARVAGHHLSLWTIGGGFDARWARLAGPLSPAFDRYVEVEEARVVTAKQAILQRSPFAELWQEVRVMPVVPAGWSVDVQDGERPVVVLEGLLHRISAQGLRTLLKHIRQSCSHAVVMLDLTGVHGIARLGWSARRLSELGWDVVDDVETAFRDLLLDRQGEEVCAGMVPVRVVKLVSKPLR